MSVYFPFFREKIYKSMKCSFLIFDGKYPAEKLWCSMLRLNFPLENCSTAYYFPNRHMGTIKLILSMFSLCAFMNLKSSKVTANRLLEHRAHQWIVFLPRLENEAEINGTIYDLTIVLFLFVKIMRLAFWQNFSRTSKIHQWARCETKYHCCPPVLCYCAFWLN